MNKFDYKGKRFLITQPIIHDINGSTLVTLELADYLQSQGADVTVYTLTYWEPSDALFEEKNIRVDVAADNPEYKLEQFDYIWVHSQVLPMSIVKELGEAHKTVPTFIFLHMSSMDWIPDEHPFIYELEEKLAARTLYICEAVRESNINYFNREPAFGYFRNPAPNSFRQNEIKREKKLRRILFVSNYLPQELREAKDILSLKGYEALILGEGEDKYELLQLDTLNQYDAVVSIAKTVHYCLVSGTPVYVYGKFGGAGWLSDANYEEAKRTNFCGSDGFGFKKTEEIVSEIEDGFSAATAYQTDNIELFQNELLIQNVLGTILEDVENKPLEPFSEPYKNMVLSSQLMMKIRFENGYRIRVRDKRIKKLRKENKRMKKTLNSRTVKLALKMRKGLKGHNK